MATNMNGMNPVSYTHLAQAAEVYHDLVKLDPTDSVAVKSEKDCMARATMQQQKWEEAKSFRDVMKNSSETNTLDKSDKKGLTRAELEERLGLLSARYAQNQQDLAVVRDIAGVYEQMEDWANAYSFYNYAFSLSNNDISLENKASEMNERCRKAQVEEIRRRAAAEPDNKELQEQLAQFSKEAAEQQVALCRPVSYTHLDVYKRQAYGIPCAQGRGLHSREDGGRGRQEAGNPRG